VAGGAILSGEEAWHSIEVEQVLLNLETSRQGLTAVEAKNRFQVHGANELEEEAKSASTGMKTEIGKIARLIKETEKAATPIRKQTADLSKKLGLFALVASGLILAISLLRGFEFLEAFLFVLAAAVSAIPEGLPVVITITLAIGVHRMAKRNAIIQKLQAVDTLGSATVICTDKTGTLTTNQMTAQQIFVNNRLVSNCLCGC